MNLSLRKVLSFLLVLILVLSMLPGVMATDATTSEDFYYGRSALATMANAQALLYAYDQIAVGMDAAQASITVREGDAQLSPDELAMVLDVYLRDHPEVFWFGNRYGYSTSGGNVVRFVPTYSYTGETLAQMRQALENQVKIFTTGINKGMSDYEKELFVHEALADYITYGYSSDQSLAHTAYGGLVNGMAVCDGYAKALQLVLHALGMRSFIAEGYSLDPNGKTVAHAWNYVEIDGNFYHVDLTWDDQGDETFHAYLNVCGVHILEDHYITPTAYPLPVCDKEENFYFKYKPAYVSEYTVESIAELVVDHGMHVALYIEGNPYTFVNWFLSNRAAIAKQAGIKGGYSYGYKILGSEVHIYFTISCDHANMTYVPGYEPDCYNTGMVAHYVCKCNKWFADAEATVEYEHHHDLILPALGHDYTKVIRTQEYLIHTPENCQDAFAYYYACSHCDDSAGDHEATKHLFYFYGNGEHDYQLNDGKVLCAYCQKEATVGAAWANNKLYTTLSEAIKYTQSGTITMLRDADMGSVTIPAGVTLDLNGYVLTTEVLLSFGDVIDSQNGVGGVCTWEFYTSECSQIPLLDAENGIYRLFNYNIQALGTKESADAVTFGFALEFENKLAYELLATGNADFEVETCLNYGEGKLHCFFDNQIVARYAENQLKYPDLQSAMLLRVSGLQYITDGTELTLSSSFYSLDGTVLFPGQTQSYIK